MPSPVSFGSKETFTDAFLVKLNPDETQIVRRDVLPIVPCAVIPLRRDVRRLAGAEYPDRQSMTTMSVDLGSGFAQHDLGQSSSFRRDLPVTERQEQIATSLLC